MSARGEHDFIRAGSEPRQRLVCPAPGRRAHWGRHGPIMTISTNGVTDSSAALDVVAGVDTHADTHHVAVLSMSGGRLGDRQVPATPAGYETLLSYIRWFGNIRLVGIEGTSSYDAGLSRHLRAQQLEAPVNLQSGWPGAGWQGRHFIRSRSNDDSQDSVHR
ncbi:IS110 family transposase [Kocuria soli]